MINPVFQKANIILLASFFFILFYSPVFAQYKQQQIEITPFAGYFLTSNLSTLDGDLVIDHNFNYGGVLDIRVSDDLFIELLYLSCYTIALIQKFVSSRNISTR
ncbi:MAG: hypothetical protein MUE64_08980 [Ignavibacteriaceae bacterium]|nr:hypothetical protein [Ignavibacteriaceae bacterium]